MAGGHILVLQMHRLGDMVMSWPLLLWLSRMYPRQPLWVVGEPAFYRDLYRLGPQAYYVPWTEIESLPVDSYDCVINLSHRPEAAALAGRLPSEAVYGPAAEPGGAVRVRGQWQLYRASIVHNNRHNRYHFAELWALDAVPAELIRATRWDIPRQPGPGRETVGLFLGASQEEKRPDASFWARLAVELARRGHKPILLGGPGEVEFGARVNAESGLGMTDLCGRTSLDGLAAAVERLGLLVTPDTGPMHLAAWIGTPTLNLSMGPVNPWETGPYQPGHLVVRPEMSCRGCWGCRRAAPACTRVFDPRYVAMVAARALENDTRGAGRAKAPGLGLYRTGRDGGGLYGLTRLSPGRQGNAADLLGAFWAAAFAQLFGIGPEQAARESVAALASAQPKLALAMARALPSLGARFRKGLAGRETLGDDFWTGSPPMLRPFAGYAHLLLQNRDFSREAWAECLGLLERLAEICRPD